MRPSNSLHLLAYTCLICGILLFTNGVLAETQPHEPIIVNNAINIMALVASLSGDLGALGFLFAFWGLQCLEAAGAGWLPKLSGGLILMGTMLGLMGSLYTLPDPNRVQYLTPLGSIGVTLGWLAYGIGVLRTGRLQSWQRFVPLMLGLFFFIQLPLQIIFFISVRGRPNYLIVVGGYGILIALLGYTMLFAKKRASLVTP